MILQCTLCGTRVEPEDCTFGGLHRLDSCFGRVFDANGKEFTGYLKSTKDWFYHPAEQGE